MSTITRREWRAEHEYNYWVVYEYRPDDNSSGVAYGQIRGIKPRRLAEDIAAALNAAFSQGVSYGAHHMTHME